MRVLPSLLEYRAANHRLPPALTFSLAALLAFYRGTEIRDGALVGARSNGPYPVKDDAPILQAFADQWHTYAQNRDPSALCRAILARTDFWGQDLSALPDLLEGVIAQLSRILQVGVRQTISTFA